MKLNFILILLGTCLLLAGCGSGPGEGLASYNFKQGVAELNVNFLENAPPQKIYPHSNFKLILKLDNQAAYDLNNGKITVVGIDDKYFKLVPLEHFFDTIQGRSLINPAGETKFITFDGSSNALFQNAESYSAQYFLKLSYDSNLEFTDTVCINPKLYNAYDSGCRVEEQKSYSGQGAPLAVTNVEEIIYPVGAGARVEFRIQLKRLGRGEADFINLKSAKLGGTDLQNCEFQGPVIDSHKALLSKEKQETLLICETILGDQSSYTTTLALEFNYGYELKEQHELNLVK